MSGHRATVVDRNFPEAFPLVTIDYPNQPAGSLRFRTPGTLSLRGQSEHLAQPLLALFCSERCPGELIIKACDVATLLRDAAVPVVSGFHSSVEKHCLRILLRGTQPLIVGPARSIERFRIPADWRDPMRQGRLSLISPFAAEQNRITAARAAQRNEFLAALARAVLVVYADPGGLVEALARRVMIWRKPLFALRSDPNANLIRAGAEAVDVNKITSCWSRLLLDNGE